MTVYILIFSRKTQFRRRDADVRQGVLVGGHDACGPWWLWSAGRPAGFGTADEHADAVYVKRRRCTHAAARRDLSRKPIGSRSATLCGDGDAFGVTVFIAQFERALLLIYGPGQYRLLDFLRAGIPVTL